MRWSGCATRPRRSASTGVNRSSERSCGTVSSRSSATTVDTSAEPSRSTAGTGRCRRRLSRCRGSFRRRGCSPVRSPSVTSTQTATAFGEISDSLSFFRNNYDAVRRLPRGHHPVARTGRRQRQGPRPARGAHLAHRRRIGRIRRRRGADTRRRPAGRPAGRAPGIRSVAGDHRAVGGRQDHAAAQPGRIVAVRVGDAALPDGDNATMFLSQLPYVPLGTSADRGVLSELAGRHLGRDVARHLDKGRAGTAVRPSRRRA